MLLQACSASPEETNEANLKLFGCSALSARAASAAADDYPTAVPYLAFPPAVASTSGPPGSQRWASTGARNVGRHRRRRRLDRRRDSARRAPDGYSFHNFAYGESIDVLQVKLLPAEDFVDICRSWGAQRADRPPASPINPFSGFRGVGRSRKSIRLRRAGTHHLTPQNPAVPWSISRRCVKGRRKPSSTLQAGEWLIFAPISAGLTYIHRQGRALWDHRQAFRQCRRADDRGGGAARFDSSLVGLGAPAGTPAPM